MSNAHLRQNPGGETQPAQEFGVVTEPGTVRLERLLPGPVERVWSYLTDSQKRGKWLASGAMEPRVGGRLELRFEHATLSDVSEQVPDQYKGKEVSHFTGRITQWDPPRLLAYSWGEGRFAESEVSFELTPRGKDVFMVVTHRRLADRAEMLSVAAGWHAHIGILIDHLNGRSPPGFWAVHTRLEAEYDRRLPK
jgi:uncharacterized protein YndB with AHSA1/START domain